jgi:serine/threonine protein kinase
VPLAGKTLPNLAYATHMSKSPGYMQDPAGTKVVTTTGSKRYLFEKSMLERTGQTGKIYKVRYADALSGGDNVRLIAKVQRTQNKVKNRQRTENKPLPVILAHSEHAAAAEAKIAQTLSPTHSTDADHLEYAAARVQVLDHFVDQVGKYYQIMPAKAGDLSDLTRLLSQKVADAPGVKPLVIKARRNVAYQSFRQLAALHQRSWSTLGGVAHRDLKLNNILFDLDGKVMLIDFDEAKQMTWRGSDGDPLENKGSIASPERHLSSLRDGTKGTGKPTDVWALAVSMLAFGAEAHANNPFNNPLCETSVGAVTQEAYFLTYAAYYAMGIDGKKGPHWAAAPTPDQEKALVTSVRQALAALSAETGRTVAVSYSSKTDGDKAIAAIAQAFSSYIRQQSDMDKELLTLLLEGGLHPHPHRRMSSAKIAQMLQEHENKLTSAERNELSVLFREVGSHTTLGP